MCGMGRCRRADPTCLRLNLGFASRAAGGASAADLIVKLLRLLVQTFGSSACARMCMGCVSHVPRASRGCFALCWPFAPKTRRTIKDAWQLANLRIGYQQDLRVSSTRHTPASRLPAAPCSDSPHAKALTPRRVYVSRRPFCGSSTARPRVGACPPVRPPCHNTRHAPPHHHIPPRCSILIACPGASPGRPYIQRHRDAAAVGAMCR